MKDKIVVIYILHHWLCKKNRKKIHYTKLSELISKSNKGCWAKNINMQKSIYVAEVKKQNPKR